MEISDEILGAYIDNELDATERATIQERIASDAALRARACELWQLKQMVRGAFPLPRRKDTKSGPSSGSFGGWPHALAASLFVAVGAISGWFANDRFDADRQLERQIEAIRSEGGRVVLHLFSDEPARMEAALRMAEQLASARDTQGRPFRVEFLANGPGLHLLRQGGSPYAERVEALRRRHANLRLVACREAIARMQERGLEVNLLPGVEEAASAESELSARLTQGWRYLQS
ncbi:DsrE family protein [Sulfuricystis multivorans]|uniref:DsrE family protein n=1 Tax=Sulfuricystis multivorans TaxID=2211108 RepID=UPI000F8255A5|nr:DsrE family protein [Sulfuricystis multivorans]